MKKSICVAVVILSMILIIMCSCKMNQENDIQTQTDVTYGGAVYFDSFSVDDYNETEIPFTVDEKLAFEIGDAALKSTVDESKLDEYYKMPAYVYEISGKNIYIVDRAQTVDGHLIDGGGFSVAISKEDGRILKIWFGE